MRSSRVAIAIAIAATLASCGAPLAPEGQVLLYVDTDAILPPAPGEALTDPANLAPRARASSRSITEGRSREMPRSPCSTRLRAAASSRDSGCFGRWVDSSSSPAQLLRWRPSCECHRRAPRGSFVCTSYFTPTISVRHEARWTHRSTRSLVLRWAGSREHGRARIASDAQRRRTTTKCAYLAARIGWATRRTRDTRASASSS